MRRSAALALLVLVLTGVAAAGESRDPFEALLVLRPKAPEPAPDVSFTSLEGRPVRLGSLGGRPVLLSFFTTW